MGKNRRPALHELQFGSLDAYEEGQHSPELLKAGYFDHRQAAVNLSMGDGWLILGPKGAGKSAAFEHLRLVWKEDSSKFYSNWNLGSFPIADVTALQIGTGPGPSSDQAAWEFLLYLRLFESLYNDQGSYPDANVTGLRNDLVRAGLIEGPDLRTKFFDWKKSTVSFNVAGFGGEGSFADTNATVIQLLEILKKACGMLRTSSKHLLAVDGLDLFFVEREEQYRSLAALVHAIASVNQYFVSQDLRVSAAIAMRSDVFDILPSTDSAKLKTHMVSLTWSDSETGPRSSLWDLIDTKARSSFREGFETLPFGDVRKDYLATLMARGKPERMPDFLLEYTRLLPRDLIALMNCIRDEHPGATQVTDAEAKRAVRSFAETYFVGEIMNNLTGALPDQSAEKVVAFRDALASLESRFFTAAQLAPELEGMLTEVETRKLLRQMYEVGGIGVIRGHGAARHTNFIYRRVGGGAFSALAEYNLHNALVEAWNIPKW